MDNKGYKVATIILVVILILQSCGMSSSINDLQNGLDQVNQELTYAKLRVSELENKLEDTALSDNYFGIGHIDMENGEITFEFTVEPETVTEDTKVVLTNGLSSVEMQKEGNVFTGSLQYPLNDKVYRTTYTLYENDEKLETTDVEYIGAALWMYKAAMTDFYGEIMYGNDKLTLAGALDYTFNIGDKISEAKLVFGNSNIELSSSKNDVVEINFSEKISLDSEGIFEELYIELTMESGVVYEIYPGLDAFTIFDVGGKGVGVYQIPGIVIRTTDGKEYKIFDR